MLILLNGLTQSSLMGLDKLAEVANGPKRRVSLPGTQALGLIQVHFLFSDRYSLIWHNSHRLHHHYPRWRFLKQNGQVQGAHLHVDMETGYVDVHSKKERRVPA